LSKLPKRGFGRFDFICANLISTLLLQEGKRIVCRLKPGGMLVLAGILQSEFAAVKNLFEKLGLKFVAGRSEKEWRSGLFVAKYV
jgi:ribosomal protein L11 methylase PrmA